MKDWENVMNERLKIGITNTSYTGTYGFDNGIERIAAEGYECIDYQKFIDIETDFFNLPAEEFDKAVLRDKEVINSHGMQVWQVHSPWRTPRDDDPAELIRWRAAMKKSIRGTHLLGASRFVVHPLMPFYDRAEGAETVWEMNLEFIADLADYAKEYGVTVCVENLPFPVYPLASVEAVCELVDMLNRDNLKVCLDTGHAAIFFGSDISGAVRHIGKRLEVLHVHDNMGIQDEHLIPGDGIIDWDGFASALSEIGFAGTISLETSPKHALHPESEWREREKALCGIALSLAEKAR